MRFLSVAGLTTALVAAGAGAHYAMGAGENYPFTTFYIPIIIAGLVAGFGASVAVTVLAAVVAWDWFIPPPGFDLTRVDSEALILFILTGTLIGWLASHRFDPRQARIPWLKQLYWGSAPGSD